MFVQADTELTASLVGAAAAAAMAEVYDDIVDLFGRHGRAEVVVHLRQRAQMLSRAASARDQLQSCAMDAAADDVERGRSPFGQWTDFLAQENWPDEALRAQVRPPPERVPPQTRLDAEAWARETEARLIRQTSDACDAARSLPARLAEEVRLQAALWDDPRLPASPATRALMQAGGEALQRRLSELGRVGGRVAAAPPAAPEPSWLGRLWRSNGRELRRARPE
jgi:hypothetical protein